MLRRPEVALPGWVGVAGAMLLALFLRLWRLDELGDLDFDEQASAFIGAMSPPEMLGYLLAAPFEHPPLFYLLLHGWLQVAGDSETAMRLFSVLIGTATVPLVGLTALHAAGPRAGTVAAVVLAVAPLHVFSSRDARMYPLLGLLMASALAALALPARAGPWRGVVAVAAAGAALATHYYAAFGAAGLAVGWLRTRPRLPLAWVAAGGGIGLVAVAAAAWWVQSASGLRTALSVVGPRAVDPREVLAAVAESLGAALAGPLAAPGWNLVLAAFTVLVILMLARPAGEPPPGRGEGPRGSPTEPSAWGPVAAHVMRSAPAPAEARARRRLESASFWGFVVPTLAVPLLLLVGRPFALRYVALAIPCLALWIGLRSPYRTRRVVGAAGAAFVLALMPSLVPLYSGYTRSDYGAALAALRAEVRPDDAIVLNGPWQDLLYRRYGWGLPPRTIIASTVPLDREEAVTGLERLVATHERVWVVDSATDRADPEGVVAAWLEAHAFPRPVIPFQNALLRPYLTDRASPRLQARPADAAALGVHLEWIALESWVLTPGDEGRLLIGGRREAGSGLRRLVARLVAPDGQQVWHWDGALHDDRGATTFRAAVTMPPSAPPGAYRLEVLVYGSAATPDGRRLVTDLSEPMVLGTVEVR